MSLSLKIFLGVKRLSDELLSFLLDHRLEPLLDEKAQMTTDAFSFKKVDARGCLSEKPNVVVIELERPSPEGNEYEQLVALEPDQVMLLLWAIKNHREVVPVVELKDLETVLEEVKKSGDVPLQLRRRFALKALHRVIQLLSSIERRLSDVFFIKDWESLALKKLGNLGNYSLFSEEEGWNVPPEFSIDVALTVHYLSLLPEGSSVFVREWAPIHAAVDGSLPEDKDGVLGLKGEYRKDEGYKFVVARKIPEGVQGLEIQNFKALERGMLAFGHFLLLREVVQENDFAAALACHPVFNSAVLVREGRLISSFTHFDEERVKTDLLERMEGFDGVEVAFNFELDEGFVETLKERGARRVIFLDSRGIWRRR